ncbi:MAG: alpha-galactosidase, partial [Pseudomonadota bacterium]
TLGGRWAGEFQEARYELDQPCQFERTSRYGRTGHGSSPTIIAGEAGFKDLEGRVMGLHLGWSGNHRILVEVRRDGSRQAQLGEWLLPGELPIEPGQSIETPMVFGAWSDQGLNGLSHQFHDYLRRQLLPRSVYAKPRPVILNTWEAVYFDHDLEALKEIAGAAAALGVERFVLDDGWFGRRDAATTSLGDWAVDPRKYPDGLNPLIDHVQALGMEFGLWIEPEMINPVSELYDKHPDWCLHVDGRTRLTHRDQLTLDLTRPEVADYLFERLDGLLQAHAIAYLKWDHNRDLAPAASAGLPAARRQTMAAYALFDRLRAAHPDVEIESCAAGGARIDFGIMRRAERFWSSDNNDPIERLGIQRGVGLLFPLEVTGAHVGEVPSHQTGRTTTIGFRARAALFGHFGLELDPRRLSEPDRTAIKAHIKIYQRFRSLLHSGRLFRFGLGDNGGFGQIVVADDGSEALAQLVRVDQAPYAHCPPVRLPGLDPAAHYRLELLEPWPEPAGSHLANPAFWRSGPATAGDTLTEIGLRLPLALPETIWLLHLRRQ